MKKQFSVRSLAIVILLVLFAIQIGAQEKIDLQMVQRIRKEGLENSKITDLLIYLCDVYGPRPPASPQYMPLIAYPKAWTPGTKGILKGNAVLLDVRNAADLPNMDVYEHLSRGDLMQAATVMAWFVCNAAMREEKLPRKYFEPNAPSPQRGRN